MNIGISVPLPAYYTDVAFLAQKGEELGFESLWCAEHPIIPVVSKSKYPGSVDGLIPESYSHFVDPFVALARASAVTSHMILGTGITLITERNPLLLAKEISTLDHFSGGRFMFGIGTGWLREETEIMGGDFDHRWTQAREAVAVLRELWTKEEAEYHGVYYNFPPVKSFPKPVQIGGPPIILGGMAPNVLKRVVAWGDGWLPNRISPEDLRKKKAELNRLAEQSGRDPKTISVNIFGQPADPEFVKAYEEAGADRYVIRTPALKSEKEVGEVLEKAAKTIL